MLIRLGPWRREYFIKRTFIEMLDVKLAIGLNKQEHSSRNMSIRLALGSRLALNMFYALGFYRYTGKGYISYMAYRHSRYIGGLSLIYTLPIFL